MAGILVVDDDRETRNTTRRFLERQGWDVSDAGGGRDAQALLRERDEPFDLLVADVVLAEDEDGLRLGEELYHQGWTRKVLFVSGLVDVDLGTVGVPGPDKDFVRKMLGLGEVTDAARGLLAGRDRALARTRTWTDLFGARWTLTFQPVWGFRPGADADAHPPVIGGRIRFEGPDGITFHHTPRYLKPLSEFPSTELQAIVDAALYDPSGSRA